jgi:hypothetical protein
VAEQDAVRARDAETFRQTGRIVEAFERWGIVLEAHVPGIRLNLGSGELVEHLS